MSYTPYNAPLLSGLLGDREVTTFFGMDAEVSAMKLFEAALTAAEGEHGVIPANAAAVICNSIDSFEPDVRAIGQAAARDGVVVPEFVRQLRRHVGEANAVHVHFGATSQDAIDTSFVLRMKGVAGLLETRLSEIGDRLKKLRNSFGNNPLMARTRMKAAIQIAVADRVDNWRTPLDEHLIRLQNLKPRFFVVQFGGSAGTLDKLGGKAVAVRATLAQSLDLGVAGHGWHSDRSTIAEFANWLALVSGSLGKIGQDIALMAQDGIDEISLSDGGGSSAMPHKQNPVQAEALITLARFNAVQLAGIHQAMVHEQERSGAAWTLEWMIMPQMVVATGAALRITKQLVSEISDMGDCKNTGK